MSRFVWKEEYLTGNKQIDYQHQAIFNTANDLDDVLKLTEKEMLSKEKLLIRIQVALDACVNYAHYHFRTEEQIMADLKYPEFAYHKLMHDKIREQLAKVEQRFETDGVAVTEDLFNFFIEWLIKHIEEVDTPLAAFTHSADYK